MAARLIRDGEVSLYPTATFFLPVGHSNGTYLLVRALELCPAVRFDRVVFGGSVVRKHFAWNKFMPGRVKAVLNYVATGDWVVAIFPQGLSIVRLQDLGGAGHYGFKDANVRNLFYVDGGHGAALGAQRWSEMAKFVVTGKSPAAPQPPPRRRRFGRRPGLCRAARLAGDRRDRRLWRLPAVGAARAGRGDTGGPVLKNLFALEKLPIFPTLGDLGSKNQ